MSTLTIIYFAAIVVEMIIRTPLNKKRKAEKMTERRVTSQESTLLLLLFVGMLLAPIIYAATNWLDFANYTLPVWAGWLGVLILAGRSSSSGALTRTWDSTGPPRLRSAKNMN